MAVERREPRNQVEAAQLLVWWARKSPGNHLCVVFDDADELGLGLEMGIQFDLDLPPGQRVPARVRVCLDVEHVSRAREMGEARVGDREGRGQVWLCADCPRRGLPQGSAGSLGARRSHG